LAPVARLQSEQHGFETWQQVAVARRKGNRGALKIGIDQLTALQVQFKMQCHLAPGTDYPIRHFGLHWRQRRQINVAQRNARQLVGRVAHFPPPRNTSSTISAAPTLMAASAILKVAKRQLP